jgi:rhodanese-related sulfurtransferase
MTTIRKAPELVAEAKKSVVCIGPEEGKGLYTNNNALFIDVREPGEVQQSAVAGAINIPRGVLEMKIEELAPDHDQLILICCGTGGRAALSAKALKEMGYTNVKVIDCDHQQVCRIFSVA